MPRSGVIPSSQHARKFYEFVRNKGAAKYDMNVGYNAFKKELEATPDRSVVYICDQSGGTISRVCCIKHSTLIGR